MINFPVERRYNKSVRVEMKDVFTLTSLNGLENFVDRSAIKSWYEIKKGGRYYLSGNLIEVISDVVTLSADVRVLFCVETKIC